jgi:small-conductance mechanosensitive channel
MGRHRAGLNWAAWLCRGWLACTLLLGSAAPASSADAPVDAAQEAPVVVANRTIAVLRAPFMGVSAERRARRTEVVLKELLDRSSAGEVTVRVEPQGHAVMVDGEMALALVAADADPLRGETLAQTSAAARTAIQRLIADTREGRDSQRRMQGIWRSALAVLAALALAVMAWRTRRWAEARVAAFMAGRAASVRVAGAELVRADRVVAVVRIIARALSWAVLAVVVYECLSFVLYQFPYTRPWGEGLRAYLLAVGVTLGQGVLHALPDLFVALAIFVIARGVIALFRPFFARVAAVRAVEEGWLDADTARPTQRLFNAAVWVFALVMAYPYLPGADSDAFKGMSVLIGLMFTIGGSSVFGQAASGLVLMYSRTIRVGEYVRINEHEGTVTAMGSFTTRVRTGLGEELTLPNSLVLGTVTKNYSRAVKGQGYVLDTTVTIGYDTPWRQVEALLLEAARRTSGVLAEPPPRVFHTALSDFYPEYRLVCQAVPRLPQPRAEVLSALHANVQDVFNEYGVQIMSPHYLGDPAQSKVVPREGWYAEPARPPAGAAPQG